MIGYWDMQATNLDTFHVVSFGDSVPVLNYKQSNKKMACISFRQALRVGAETSKYPKRVGVETFFTNAILYTAITYVYLAA